MNWFKRLFQNNDTKLQEGDYVFGGNFKEPATETPNIGEPVLSFIECVRNNRRRFSFKTETYCRTQIITLIDKQTGEQWCAKWYLYFERTEPRLDSKLDWLTEQEKSHLIKELSKIAKERAEQLRSVNAIRKNRQMTKERDRLKGVYCK